MDKQFLWNFKFTNQHKNNLREIVTNTYPTEGNLFWEKRYFWPEKKQAIVNNATKKLLNVEDYKMKSHQDTYLLLPSNRDNLKIRNHQLTLKTLLKVEDECYLYCKKIKLAEFTDTDQIKKKETITATIKN